MESSSSVQDHNVENCSNSLNLQAQSCKVLQKYSSILGETDMYPSALLESWNNVDDQGLFDRLPDEIVLTIFNKVQDAKSLCISSILCKRFQSLITQTHNVSLTIQPGKQSSSLPNTNPNQFVGFLKTVLLKPFQFLVRQITKKKDDKCKCCTCSYASPAEFLTSFGEMKKLEVKLPTPESNNIHSDQSLLKWKAEFGSQLKTCLIIGGTSIAQIRENDNNNVANVIAGGGSESIMTNDEFKLRIVWVLSSLIAASARHCLLEETIKEKKSLENVVISDDIGQGKCCMSGEQVEEMRRNTTVISSNGKKVPAMKMKMWYVPELELPAKGCVMKGATMVVIRPVNEWSKAEDDIELVAGGLSVAGERKEGEKVFDEAAKEMVKLKCSYSLEMNSF